jgi:hypothetical protein
VSVGVVRHSGVAAGHVERLADLHHGDPDPLGQLARRETTL